LRVVVDDSSYSHVDELLTAEKVLDMKKLFFHIKARYAMEDCDALHFLTTLQSKHIDDVAALLAKYRHLSD
jgi:hypothetical protein